MHAYPAVGVVKMAKIKRREKDRVTRDSDSNGTICF